MGMQSGTRTDVGLLIRPAAHLPNGIVKCINANVGAGAAVPQPDPKTLTDEELAKIGIHMANRLQPDGAKGQSTWADIDDEDEDWDAPEAITWTDGTKTTIPHVDETETQPEPPVVKENKVVEKPRSPAPPSGSPSVKPGFLASGKGLVLKSGASSEKPTLVAKPPAPPTPVKSPWAQLPPVSKVSPMEVPNEQPQSRFLPPGQGYNFRGGPPPAAREIAADDFSRSPRRDNQQLFNSQSGRYEPVADRRGIARPDFQQRQPAVLQRPGHSDAQGPAEPSAAFQTSHNSGAYGGGYSRRRNSSNVSGGSGSFQRMGRPYDQSMPPPEIPSARRSSITSAGDQPISPQNFSPSVPQSGPRQPSASPYQHRASPALSSSTPHIPEGFDAAAPQGAAAPPGGIENTVEFQKRLMQERRAEAIKRRQEEEAREEAARKERLAKKLAALGPAPERKSARKDDSQEAAKALVPKPTESPEVSSVQATQDPQSPTTTVENTPELLNGVQSGSQTQTQTPNEIPQPSGPENKHGHPFQPRLPPNQPERIWPTGSTGLRNVWATPNNDRTLGNGTFSNAPFDAASAQTAPIQGRRHAPGPIAPPRTTAPAGHSSRLGPIAPPQRNGPGGEDNEREKNENRNRWSAAVKQDDADIHSRNHEKRIELERDMEARGMTWSDLDRQYHRVNDQWTETNEEGRVVKRPDEVTYGSEATWHASRQDDKHRLAAARSSGPNGSTAAIASQQSRFFPSSNIQQPEPLAPDTGRPPEEGGSHPAFDGDVLHPHVSLPRTKPIVKLPPAPGASSNTSQRLSQPAPNWGQGPSFRDDGLGRNQPLRSSFGAASAISSQGANSQIVDRIKNLFADKPSSVSSSSRTALAQATPVALATVSLPGIYAPSAIVDERSFVTKTMDEDCFEEQEMGSLPPVHLPADTPEAAYNLARHPPRQDRRLVPIVPATADAFLFTSDGRVFIHLPNNNLGRKSVPMAALRSPNPRRGPRTGSRYGSTHRGGNRSRDSSTPYSPEQASSSNTTSARGGRSYRGRSSENWTRGAPAAAIHTQ